VSTGIFIQVRLGSTRLPRKALLPLRGGNVIQHVMRSLAGVPAEARALLTDTRSVEELRPFAETEGYAVFGGPDEDVLARYCLACREFTVDTVIRATGDNPLTSARLAVDILGLHRAGKADLSHYLGCPWGMGVEVVEASALFAAEHQARAADEREHITTFLYRNRERFTILEPQAPAFAYLPEAVVTVDTQDDYSRVTSIFEALSAGEPVEAEQVVAWFRQRAGDD
jgi:spore coat polysaccharide biosynthesis protein SpsF